MSRIRQALDLAIESTAESFLENPANFSDERALAEDIRSRLNTLLQPVSVVTVMVEESSGAKGNITNHEAYTAHYRETTEIDRAQCEVGGKAFPIGGQERLDMGIFSDSIEIRVVGGTQEFNPSDLSTALEFKYVKNTNYLRYRPDDKDSKYHEIADDIKRLGTLSGHIDCRCVVFSNYDLFRRDRDADAKRRLLELADQSGVTLQFVLPAPLQSSS
ncbi:hypothetical protein HLRTI_001261 [Halorhabdus tiamatea SARL4B]|uniref:Uncharacterized protein n=1 Tax=Halorhabdus tiamatea SARL4B TaxID=1033806 RepID=U2E425_9EURY|nr:hypothetical protein [Halorhabdus tiamatea]ERJ06706.1 hypothetical protein HLRTI_001261 [Halorhabdus tiamatea SARL4B]